MGSSNSCAVCCAAAEIETARVVEAKETGAQQEPQHQHVLDTVVNIDFSEPKPKDVPSPEVVIEEKEMGGQQERQHQPVLEPTIVNLSEVKLSEPHPKDVPIPIEPRVVSPTETMEKAEADPKIKSEAPKGCFGAFRYRIEQQEPTRRHTPYLWIRWPLQACCAGSCAVVLGLMGAFALSTAGSIKQVEVSYKYPDLYKEFTVDEDMSDGDVNMWYDLHGVVGINQKRYIENVDATVIKMFFMGKKVCDNAEHKSDVAWRRNETLFRQKFQGVVPIGVAPDKFTQLVARVPDGGFRPCGLQSLAMFTDEYTLSKYVGDNPIPNLLHLDESDIVLKPDEDIFEDNPLITPYNTADYTGFKIDGEVSWLMPGPFYDHYKVWLRSSASTHVRHLWAVLRGGLSKGKYRLDFPQNSAIWTAPVSLGGWNLDDKKVVFSTRHVLGSKGACMAAGVICVGLAAFEVLALIFFVCMPKPKSRILGGA